MYTSNNSQKKKMLKILLLYTWKCKYFHYYYVSKIWKFKTKISNHFVELQVSILRAPNFPFSFWNAGSTKNKLFWRYSIRCVFDFRKWVSETSLINESCWKFCQTMGIQLILVFIASKSMEKFVMSCGKWAAWVLECKKMEVFSFKAKRVEKKNVN